jgi:hypothetical protein
MSPKIQQILLSTPICNGEALSKIAKTPSTLLTNQAKTIIQNTLNQLEDKLNPN